MRALRLASWLAAAVVVLGGLLVLIGCQLDLQWLRTIGPVYVVTNPLSALLSVVTGSALVGPVELGPHGDVARVLLVAKRVLGVVL